VSTPVCEFCGEPAALNKSGGGNYRKYCGDICMTLASSLKPMVTEKTDRVRIRELAGIIQDSSSEMMRLVKRGQPKNPAYSSGFGADAQSVTRRTVSLVGGLI
jgi:hypothetical protein